MRGTDQNRGSQLPVETLGPAAVALQQRLEHRGRRLESAGVDRGGCVLGQVERGSSEAKRVEVDDDQSLAGAKKLARMEVTVRRHDVFGWRFGAAQAPDGCHDLPREPG